MNRETNESRPAPPAPGWRISRRSFLLLGAGGATVAAVGSIPGAPRTLDRIAEEGLHRHLPDAFVESVCGDCPAACPILVRTMGGCVVGVRPLEARPCMRAYTIPQQLVHPDRLLAPMERVGGKGDDRWRETDAGAARGRLSALLREHRARTALLIRDDGDLASLALGGLAACLGVPRVARAEWPLEQGPVDALDEATGWGLWEPDLAGATGVLAIGFDFHQCFSPPVAVQQAYRAWIGSGQRHPVVSISPRLDLTASNADQWYACRVGTEPLVALAVAAFVLRQRRHDPAVEKLEGFRPLADALAALDVAKACRRCGMRPADVESIARLAGERRWICLGPRGRLADQRPFVLLNALLGRIRAPGGWMPAPRASLDGMDAPPARPREVLDAVEAGEVDLLVLYGEDPAFASLEPTRWRRALRKVANLVVFSEIYTETTRLADLVIPIPHPAERPVHAIRVEGGKGTIRETAPAIAAPAQAVDPLSLWRALGRELADVCTPAYPEATGEIVSRLRFATAVQAALRFPGTSWEEPKYPQGEFHLLLEAPVALLRMTGAHLPYLLTAVSPHLRRWWETTVEIHPKSARRLGIADNDLVRVSSPAGEVKARARLFEGVPPDGVCMVLGTGRSLGAFAGDLTGNPAELIHGGSDGDDAPWETTKVNVEAI